MSKMESVCSSHEVFIWYIILSDTGLKHQTLHVLMRQVMPKPSIGGLGL